MPEVRLVRRYYFSAIHTIPQEDFIHGHNYSMDVSFSGPMQESGWIHSRDHLDQIVQKCFIDKLDRSWVNESILPATGENLAKLAFEEIQRALPDGLVISELVLHETRKNSFTVLSQ